MEEIALDLEKRKTQLFREKIKQLVECDKIISTETVNAIVEIIKDVEMAENNVPSSDEFDEELEKEYRNMNDIFDLPHDTYSLTEIKPELPFCVKYGIRSGLTHLNMPLFSPLSRGYQGGAIAIAAFATAAIHKSRCWNEAVIDQIIEDGDTFYCESYKDVNTGDRRTMTILDLKRNLLVQKKFNIRLKIEEPEYVGKFRSCDPTELHLAKALELFFERHDAGILTSPVLDVAIWRDSKYYNIFDGRARKDNGKSVAEEVSGSAKLFLVKDLMGVLFIILEKSNVRNEHFLIYAITVCTIESISPDDFAQVEKTRGKLQRRPSGYKIRQKHRAVVQGSYHLTHPAIPRDLRDKGHLIIAVAALIYSRLINANKWTTGLLDLIINQSNIYLVDLVRILEKKLDDEFELRLENLMSDVILGVYSAKIKVDANVMPEKNENAIDNSILEFFETRELGILEIKNIFYAIWKDGDAYYFLDPFACDDEGFRISHNGEHTKDDGGFKGAACVTMNSTVNEVVEIVLGNTGNKDRDPFLIHGLTVLYVKTGVMPGGPLERVIYRERGTNRRPRAPSPPVPMDVMEKVIDTTPRMRPDSRKSVEKSNQFPEIMQHVDKYTMEEDVIKVETADDTKKEPSLKFITGYRMVNVHCLLLRGTKNCLSENFRPQSRGRQGLIAALTVLTYRRLKDPTSWRNVDVDQIVDVSNKAYEQTNVIDGDANPLANLAEALERYFERYPEAVLENKRLMYAIWKEDGKFFMFNPYGSDSEGWRLRDHPASFAVADSLNELIDLLHGVLEYNDSLFSLHFVTLDAIQPGKYTSPVEVMMPDEQTIDKFRTKFLPITDDDLLKLEKVKPDITVEALEKVGDEVEEEEESDAPYRLNLALLTSTVKIQEPIEEELNGLHEEVMMEKMKYNHPPPYVMPPRKTLYVLLEAKRANRSIPSLVSRFSIDSRLEVKEKNGFPTNYAPASVAIVSVPRDAKPSKMIKLSFGKYLYSRLLPIRMMPLRAIDESYIQDEDVDNALGEKCLEREKLEEKKEDVALAKLTIVSSCARSELIPLGPIIKTPVLTIKHLTCPDEQKRKSMSKTEKETFIIKKNLTEAEKFLFKMIFPNFNPDLQSLEEKVDSKKVDIRKAIISSDKKIDRSSEAVGFKVVEDENVEIIRGNSSLMDRAQIESSHFKPCYIAAVLCILAKIVLDTDLFCGSTLDELILLAGKIDQHVGRLRYKEFRTFYNVNIFDANFNVILKEIIPDPKSSISNELDTSVEKFLEKNRTGILVLTNCAYAFWTADNRYYLFDPYPCNEKGHASKEGCCCLLRFRDLKSMLDRIKTNAGETKPFRLYTVSIAHMEMKKCKRKRRKGIERRAKFTESVKSEEKRDAAMRPSASEISLIELAEWVTSDPELDPDHDVTIPGFTPMRCHEASMLEAIVLENDITTPALMPFEKRTSETPDDEETTIERAKPSERIFRNYTSLAIPIDLCIMAWSLIHDPVSWSERTVDGLLEASADYAFDSVLASEDTSVSDMTDGLLPEFEIANYAFRAVFAPLHYGKLYATEGWNLAMTMERIFETRIYTGAIIVCNYAHVGVTKCGKNYFAWWTVTGTKRLQMIVSSCINEFLKLIVKVIDAPQETGFAVRVVTISYALKTAPDCSDIRGLHEPMAPTKSLAEIHRKKSSEFRNVEAIFISICQAPKPIFVLGTVALRDRNSLLEPRTKRCYFVALLVVAIKRDVVQSPLPGMIDRILEVAESLYRGFVEPKFHVEHILRNVPLMNRLFDFRDCASPLVTFTTNPRTGENDFYIQVKRHLKRHFKMHTSGILHFTNCCYGFWYSKSTNCYYYLDPYQCDVGGKKTFANGKACLCIFSSICQMTKHMYLNQYEGTTGFYIHRIHVSSIDTLLYEKFQEDPMWMYLDYHWNFKHSIMRTRRKAKNGDISDSLQLDRQFWNNYAVEIPDLIYSVWGTIGAYDCHFGERAGKNRVAICVAILAMQHLCHPSRWSPAILDSAVICGDSYYTESLKSAVRSCSKSVNRFGLRTTLRVFPHLWTVNFGTSVCGILYGDRNRLTLTSALKSAFEGARNVIIECNEITLAVLAAKDAYYVADPCWIGPPLFARERNAIYVLRCKNVNVLIYAITKMFNTNQRLGVRITPLKLAFHREDFDADSKFYTPRRKILPKSLRKGPGKIENPSTPIPGAVTVPDTDFYLRYRRYLADGITGNLRLEGSPLQNHRELALNPENANSTFVSTKWRLNLGQARPLKRPKPPADPLGMKRDLADCVDSATELFRSRRSQISVTELITACDNYPRPMDFASDAPPPGIESLECASKRDFIREQNRMDFNKRVADMSRNIYKSYRHRLPKNKRSGNLPIDAAKNGAENIPETYSESSEATTVIMETH
ncbi:uncharacterized protein LOC114931026 [Nylanderia fulva]|uniref:uncharacterized protein LOC114931026 n=1 Tax=Nylanderia fulva TaxID=613905 RepID=UPI0010FB7F35|nr:uncharacterized protein LOC114931026 [Nylanderia fulva]